MRETALAVCLAAPQAPVRLNSIEVAEPGPGEVTVRLEACGVCHSDLMISQLESLPLTPLVLGHEGIGVVEALGAGVTHIAVGTRVGINYLASSCGSCEACRRGAERFCLRQHNHGYTRHGALTTRGVFAAQNLIALPPGLNPVAAAPLCCAGWTAYGAVREANLQSGQLLAIFGLGGLGHLALHYARHRGLRVAAVDVSPQKLEFAQGLGAEAACTVEDARKVIGKELGGAHGAIVFAASATAVATAFQTLKRGASLILVGMTAEKFSLGVTETVLKGIRIQGSYLGTRQDLETVFDLAAQGLARPQVHSYPIDQAPEIFARLKAGQILGRAVIEFQAS
ncbi:MAG: alcohol dehydrogenase catalytic domain-containing protein [Bryobacteraceae bacterium]|nr:alcohol dehydrogenase catalytic domain-containing protein [Bryobacteraceae bacterium]MDW8377769.1 alcohol dehydrogenase catalytic domain-containing protein [Bryobacterales bacterium]